MKLIELSDHYDEEVEIQGFIESIRNIKWVQFLVIRDLSGKVQVTIEKSEEKNAEMVELVNQTAHIKDKLAQYERMENTLNRAIMMAQKTSDQIKSNAHRESEIILDDAKKNASRIVNESLLKAEQAEAEANMLKRNINIFKRKLRGLIETQLEMVEDIEKVEF